jgi:hypothetical protein
VRFWGSHDFYYCSITYTYTVNTPVAITSSVLLMKWTTAYPDGLCCCGISSVVSIYLESDLSRQNEQRRLGSIEEQRHHDGRKVQS